MLEKKIDNVKILIDENTLRDLLKLGKDDIYNVPVILISEDFNYLTNFVLENYFNENIDLDTFNLKDVEIVLKQRLEKKEDNYFLSANAVVLFNNDKIESSIEIPYDNEVKIKILGFNLL